MEVLYFIIDAYCLNSASSTAFLNNIVPANISNKLKFTFEQHACYVQIEGCTRLIFRLQRAKWSMQLHRFGMNQLLLIYSFLNIVKLTFKSNYRYGLF